MKLIDYGLCLTFVFIGIMCVWSYKRQVLTAHAITNSQVNDFMDEAVRDCLEKTIMEMYEEYGEYNYIDKLPEYKDLLAENIKKEVAFIINGGATQANITMAENRIQCAFLVWGDKMYIYNGEKGDFLATVMLENNEHERYLQIVDNMEKVSGYKLNLPEYDYSGGRNIGEYSFSVLFRADKGIYGDMPYVLRCFSSAELIMASQ